MKNKLVICSKNCKYFIAGDNNDYYITKNTKEAKDFKWSWLWCNKKYILEGVQKRFGNHFGFCNFTASK